MPAIECLKLLSEIYQIRINEILTGEKRNEEEYKGACPSPKKFSLSFQSPPMPDRIRNE